MHYPQLLVYETDRRLATILQPLADKNDWVLREPRHLSAVSRSFDRAGPGVLVLQLSRDVERELSLLEQVSWLHPDAAIVLVTDLEWMGLAGLAWDFGVRWILPPPHTRERLTEIIVELMRQFQPQTAQTGDDT